MKTTTRYSGIVQMGATYVSPYPSAAGFTFKPFAFVLKGIMVQVTGPNGTYVDTISRSSFAVLTVQAAS
jgi:hypothetical protein